MDRSSGAKRHVDRDGVITTEGSGIRTSVWLLVLAMTIVGLALFVVVRPLFESSGSRAPAPPAPDPGAQQPAARAAATPPTGAVRVAPVDAPEPPGGDSHPEPRRPILPQKPAPQPAAAAEESDEADADPNQHEPSGIAVFPPPGTKPIKRGIIVPDDAELPPGYVRHYQTTDEGRLLPPILMFHPDYQPVDEHGAPIPLPEDRVVPPDMVPEGIPLQALEVPDDGTAPTGTSARGRQDFDHPREP